MCKIESFAGEIPARTQHLHAPKDTRMTNVHTPVCSAPSVRKLTKSMVQAQLAEHKAYLTKLLARELPPTIRDLGPALFEGLSKPMDLPALAACFQAIKLEAEHQHKLWFKASSNSTKRSKDYRLPALPAPFAALTPDEFPQESADFQTDLNYNWTLTALKLCGQLILRQAQLDGGFANAESVLVRDSLDNIFKVSVPADKTMAELKKAYVKSLKFMQRIEADNYVSETVFADLVTQGYGCEGPLELLDWLNVQ
jgi:hypothetical protein